MLAGVAFLLLFHISLSMLVTGDQAKLAAARIPRETEFSRLVQSLTLPGDRIIAYSFRNYQYIASRRLPASGDFFYLPWQEEYNRAPRYGIRIDACSDIKSAAPKVMLIDKWNVWDRFPWMSYAGCVQDIIDTSYVQVPNRPYYIRKDLVAVFTSALSHAGSLTMAPSAPLGADAPIALKPIAALSEFTGDRKLTGLSVMFGTHARINPGTARLELTRQDGSLLTTDISLPDLADNGYAHFAFPADIYKGARIVAVTGGGVSVWESLNAAGQSFSCLQFTFSDGTQSFTQGCPWI